MDYVASTPIKRAKPPPLYTWLNIEGNVTLGTNFIRKHLEHLQHHHPSAPTAYPNIALKQTEPHPRFCLK